MAVTQYVGSRYVPLFADPIEWSSANTYEPLTIVSHLGNSYTSRQYVPVGVDIADTDYWALTGNYNAQVEQYRRETAAAREAADAASDAVEVETQAREHAIGAETQAREQAVSALGALLPSDAFSADATVKDYVDSREQEIINYIDNNKSSISYVGRYGAEEKTNNIDWSSILNQIAAVSNTIDFGSGQWYIDSPIILPNSITNIVGCGCILKATSEMSNMFVCKTTLSSATRFVQFNGLTIDGNDIVDTLLYQTEGSGNTLNIYNCSFKNFNKFGVYTNLLGAFVSNCLFANQLEKNKACAIHCTTDNVIVNCKMFYMKYGIAITSGIVSNCYMFTQQMTEPSYGIVDLHILTDEYTTASNANKLYVSGCEFDCITRVFAKTNQIYITGCNFYWNGKDDVLNTDRYIFWLGSRYRLNDIIISNNIFGASPDNPILGTIKTFGGNDTNHIINRYYSENNILQFLNNISSYPATASIINIMSKIYLTVGFIKNIGLECNSNNHKHATHFYFNNDGITGNINPNISFTSYTNYIKDIVDGFHIASRGNDTSIIEINTNGSNTFPPSKLLINFEETYNNVTELAFTQMPIAINEISIGNSPIVNMHLIDDNNYNESDWSLVRTASRLAFESA